MRHLIKTRKFGRTADFRKAFLWNLAGSLILKEQIRTTGARAKEIRSLVEKALNKAKNNTLANRRILLKNLAAKPVIKLFKDLAPRFKERKGGCLRILRIGARKNDGAEMVIIEFVK